jgi:hypothetical protein
VNDLVIKPPSGHRRISKEVFVTRFPEALEGESLSVPLLAQACRDRSAEDLQSALIVGFSFHFSPRHEDLLCQLALANWHVSHEDVISALDKIRATSEKAVDTLYETSQISLPYLAYDSSGSCLVGFTSSLTTLQPLGRAQVMPSRSIG